MHFNFYFYFFKGVLVLNTLPDRLFDGVLWSIWISVYFYMQKEKN